MGTGGLKNGIFVIKPLNYKEHKKYLHYIQNINDQTWQSSGETFKHNKQHQKR